MASVGREQKRRLLTHPRGVIEEKIERAVPAQIGNNASPTLRLFAASCAAATS